MPYISFVFPMLCTRKQFYFCTGLHSAAGNKDVLELHGSIHKVICTNCNNEISRGHFQENLYQINPSLRHLKEVTEEANERTSSLKNSSRSSGKNSEMNLVSSRPDGDMELGELSWHALNVPECHKCMGYGRPKYTAITASLYI